MLVVLCSATSSQRSPPNPASRSPHIQNLGFLIILEDIILQGEITPKARKFGDFGSPKTAISKGGNGPKMGPRMPK